MTYHRVYNESNAMGATCGTGTANSSGDPGFTFFHAPQFTPVFNGVRVARSSVFCVMYCRLFFVLFWPLYCLSFFWLPLLVSSNFSYVYLKTGMISFSEGLNIWQLNGHDMSSVSITVKAERLISTFGIKQTVHLLV